MIPDVLFFFVFLHLEGALHTVEEKSTLVTFWVSLSPGAAPWAGPVEAGGGWRRLCDGAAGVCGAAVQGRVGLLWSVGCRAPLFHQQP